MKPSTKFYFLEPSVNKSCKSNSINHNWRLLVSEIHTFQWIVKNLLILIPIVFLVACDDDNAEPKEVLVEHLTISGDFIEDGGSSQMSVIITPSNATNTSVQWSVSNELMATIDGSGLLKAVSNGIVTVTAKAMDGSGITASKSIAVSGVQGPIVLVSSLAILGGDISDGKPQQLAVEVLPANATNKEVIWSVSDGEIAEVSVDGLLTPKANGEVIVTVKASDASNSSSQKVIAIAGVVTASDGVVVDNVGDILAAINSAAPGDNIYVRGGSYSFSSTISIGRDGSSGNKIKLLAYPEDTGRPVFDFSAMPEDDANRGVQLSGDYWHVKGINFYHAGDNGMFVSGHYNLVEFCDFYENADTGLQLGNGASNNTILNCDAYYNADSGIEDADGFACKLNAGDGNKFVGCRAWQNLDDGWDGYLRGSDNITTAYENCWAFQNGMLKDGTLSGGDGNGFKTGGSDFKDLKHHAVFRNCLAVANVVDGFDHNSNRGDVTLYNCTAHNNGRNINFRIDSSANTLIVKNTLSIGSGGNSFEAGSSEVTSNSWQNELNANESDFVSMDFELLKSARNPDGSLPEIDYLKLVSGSDLIDAGVDVGIEFEGSAPDIGAFEFEN